MSLTLAIIKPDAVSAGYSGKIISHLEAEGFRVCAMRMERLNRVQAGAFYEVHKGRPFFDDLVEFMKSGPIIPIVLEADNAVKRLRDTIGATDPDEAVEGTIRKLYAESKGRNAIHASDSDENAGIEINFFFSDFERLNL